MPSNLLLLTFFLGPCQSLFDPTLGGAKNTFGNTHGPKLCLGGHHRKFWDCFSNGLCFAACVSPRKLPSVSGDDTLRVDARQRGHKSTKVTHSVVLCVGGLLAWTTDRCSNKDAGKREQAQKTRQRPLGLPSDVHAIQCKTKRLDKIPAKT